MRTELLIPYPPSVNGLFANSRDGGRHRTAEYRKWIAEAGWLVVTQKDGHNRHSGRVRVTLQVRRPNDQRRRDLGNLSKAVDDLLVTQGILADDSQIAASAAEWVYSGIDGARVIVEDIEET